MSRWAVVPFVMVAALGCETSGGFMPLNRAALRASKPQTIAVAKAPVMESVAAFCEEDYRTRLLGLY